jgi:hypothetical protein
MRIASWPVVGGETMGGAVVAVGSGAADADVAVGSAVSVVGWGAADAVVPVGAAEVGAS